MTSNHTDVNDQNLTTFIGDTNSSFVDLFGCFNATKTMLQPFKPSWLSYTYFVITCLILTLGLFGNTSTVVIIWRSKDRFKPHNMLVIVLAVADGLTLITSFTGNSTVDVLGTDIRAFNDITCKLHSALFLSAILYSSLITVLICIERFVCVWFPLNARLILSKRFITLLVCTEGIFAILAGVTPSILNAEVSNGVCIPVSDTNNSFTQDKDYKIYAKLFGVTRLAVLTVLIILTALIVLKLFKQQATRKHITAGQRARTGSVRITVMLTMIAVQHITLVGVPTLIVWAFASTGITIISSGESWAQVAEMGIATAVHINHSINFVFYSVCQEEFRKKLVNGICFCQRICQASDKYEDNVISRDAGYRTCSDSGKRYADEDGQEESTGSSIATNMEGSLFSSPEP